MTNHQMYRNISVSCYIRLGEHGVESYGPSTSPSCGGWFGGGGAGGATVVGGVTPVLSHEGCPRKPHAGTVTSGPPEGVVVVVGFVAGGAWGGWLATGGGPLAGGCVGKVVGGTVVVVVRGGLVVEVVLGGFVVSVGGWVVTVGGGSSHTGSGKTSKRLSPTL